MASEWHWRTLGELTDNFDSLRVPVKAPDRRPGPYPYYGASGVVDHVDQYLFDGEYLLVAEDGENLKTRTTPIAFLARRRFWVNNHAHVVRGNSQVDTRFLMYALAAADINGYLSGSAMPKLTQASLNRIPLFVPELAEQQRIAEILGALDDKIDLNHRMSQTLESMARALFKSWFVDFDPVRAKSESRDPGLPSAVAELFPASLVESDVGEIPVGWRVANLGDLIELAYGKAMKGEDRNPGSVAVYGSNGQVGWHDEALARGPGIVVGRKGNPGTVTWVTSDFFPIDTTFYVVPRSPRLGLGFLYHALRNHDLASLGADSAVPGLNRNLAYMSRQLVPPMPIVDEFDRLVEGLSQRGHACVLEASSLSALRDSLLPQLLSGVASTPDAGTTSGAS